MGLTLFWGYCGLPVPYAPAHGVTMCIADPIPVARFEPPPPLDGDNSDKVMVPDALIDELLNKV